jgi:drug/metabolite transporter (DMT)-like permease
MKSEIFTKTWPYIAVILAHTIWGVNFVIAKITLEEVPPMSLAFLRFALALILLLPFLMIEKKKEKIKKEDLPKLFAVGVLMVVLNIAFFYTGLIRTAATSASALTMIIPVVSVIGGWLFLREKIYTINLTGIGLGLVGALAVIGLPSSFRKFNTINRGNR